MSFQLTDLILIQSYLFNIINPTYQSSVLIFTLIFISYLLSRMSVFQSKIQWNFKDFDVNTVWASQKAQRGDMISSHQIKEQKRLSKIQNLSALIKNIDPFSLIRQDLDLRVWDKKKRLKKEGSVFEFSKGSGYFGSQDSNSLIKGQDDQSTNVKVINDLNNYLVQNWCLCDQLISSLQKDEHPLAKILNDYINTHESLEVSIIGSNPVAVNKREKALFYGIKYFDQSQNLKRLIHAGFDQIQEETYLISKYIIFDEKQTFYELELSVSFPFKESPHSIKEVLTTIIQVKDSNEFFNVAIQNFEKNKIHPLSDYSFIAHGDYIQYPYKEQMANKRKFMKQESYSLAFQGGGAKGVAYVGAYSSIREMEKQGKPVPITSIMGSSAGGIIALAVSTNIDPYEVQKICYKMGKIPRQDRIDRKYLESLREKYPTKQSIDEKAQEMLQKLILLLNEYGILQKLAIDKLRQFIRKLDKQKVALVFKRLVEYVLASKQSIGQIFDYKDGAFQQFNYLGLLLEGALMRGEAIHDIGSECLVKYVLLNDKSFLEETHKCQIGDKLSKQLKDHVSNFDVLCQRTLLVPLEQIVHQKKLPDNKTILVTRTLFTIINKIFMVFDRNLANIHRNDAQKRFALLQRFILNQRFAQVLLKYFEYKPIYNKQKHLPDSLPQSISKKCPQLYKILYNHHRLHPDSKEMGVKDLTQKKARLHAITDFLEKHHQISYQALTQFLAEEYFLDSKNFLLKKQYKKIALKDLLTDIFLPKGYDRIFDDKYFVRELAQIITQTLTPDAVPTQIDLISNYRRHFQQFKKTVQKITLSTYYKLTKIELTCTSVDLQNKILRFFNHKTSPDLTVCRAVQMTGSFPVGFQAQTWKQQWGNYFIHYDDYRRQVLLAGHQFTDGGMLANFPMKYFDNDFISDCYFSHRINRNAKDKKHPYETIMLGFGLDKLDSDRYTQSQGQIQRNNLTQKESAKAKAMLMKALVDAVGYTGGKLNMVSLGIKLKGLIDAFRYPNATQIQWSKIQPNLISDIPLFNFVAKLLNSYPKADRNLNLECFKDRIYQTKMIEPQKSIIQKAKESRIKLLSYIQSGENNQQNINKIFAQEKSSWLPGWLNRGKKSDKEQQNIQKNVKILSNTLKTFIKDKIDQTPLINYFLNIKDSYKLTLTQQKDSDIKLELEKVLNLKKKIKQQLFSIILNRMKLDLSQSELQLHTLIFFSLRYNTKVKANLNDLSLRKFQDQIKRQYYGIEEQLPFQKFKQKMFETELIVNYNLFDPQKFTEEQLKNLYEIEVQKLKRSLIQQKRDYIKAKLNDNDKREYLNLTSFYLTQNQRYLLQYIFLSKLNVKDLDHANQFLRKTSFKSILQHYELKGNDWYSYITIKDLKAFYRRLFSKDKLKYPCQYDENTLLVREQLLEYERQEQVKAQLNEMSIELATKFHQTVYLNRGVSVNHIHSQLLEIQKSNIERIQFIHIIQQTFSNYQNRKDIKTSLVNLIIADHKKYNKLLANILYPNDKKKIFQDAYFEQLMNNQTLRKCILTLLFNQDGLFYSQNEYVIDIYNIQFQRFKLIKQQTIKEINQFINQQVIDKKQNGNSLKVLTTFLDILQQQTGFKLLLKRLNSAIKTNYYLKDADLSSGMGIETDRKYRQAIRNQINTEQDFNSTINKEMIQKAKKYQQNFHVFQQFIRSIRYSIKNFQFLQQNLAAKKVQFIMQIEELSGKMIHNFVAIRYWLIHQLNRINKMPVESIRMYHIQEVYTLDYDGFKGICQQLLLIFNKVQEYLNKNKDLNPDKLNNISYLEKIYGYIKYFDNNNFDLPHFETVWNIYYREFKFKEYSNSLLRSLNKQFTNTYVTKLGKKCSEIKIHLILQGCDLSNNYYAYYYQLFNLFKENLEKIDSSQNLMPYMIQKNAKLLKIRAITTSSYHSIFGFLIALNYSTCHVKNQMSAIREIAQHLQSKKSVQQYFDSYKWCNITSQDYKQFWSYIKAEKYNFFRQLQKLANKSLPNHNLTSQFSEIRSIYEHQQDKIMRYCEDILDDVASNIQQIDSKVDNRYKALQISQKYAYNYTCSFNKQHQYGVISEHSYGLYQKIVKRLFTAYGSLLEAIITNAYSAQAKIQLPNIQSGFICKAFLVKQVLSTFKLKEFVISKLKQNNLRQNISLADFFNQAPNKILLNFTTINVHKARLEFMNKNTLPNMPVWAAIVSASCLPYFYNDFQCPREWQNAASDVKSLYELIVDDFFASNVMDYKKAKYISGNIISSIPMELLTNQTTLLKMFSFEKDAEPYLHLGYSFDSNESNYKQSTFKLKRNYLEVSLLQDIPLLWNLNPPVKFNKNCNKDNDKHKNLNYESQAGLMSKLSAAKSKSEFTKYIGILTQSNDNFILYMYWNRLIRLPIKIDTLDFHQITDKFLEKTYGVNVASGKTKNTVERSYEISKYFQKSHFGDQKNRYQINLRITIIDKEGSIYGNSAYYAKIQLLSHSKWNRNRYNNFLVSYAFTPHNFGSNAKNALQSQILWNLCESSKIYLRFYVPKYSEKDQQYSSIQFSEVQFNLSEIINQLPLKNSYDYSFNFYKRLYKADFRGQSGFSYAQLQKIAPYKKNQIPINRDVKNPALLSRFWYDPREGEQKPYIRPLLA